MLIENKKSKNKYNISHSNFGGLILVKNHKNNKICILPLTTKIQEMIKNKFCIIDKSKNYIDLIKQL